MHQNALLASHIFEGSTSYAKVRLNLGSRGIIFLPAQRFRAELGLREPISQISEQLFFSTQGSIILGT